MHTELEKKLMATWEEYRERPDADITAFYDGSPFTEYKGMKVRAMQRHGKWTFRAIIRYGFTGFNCSTLEESIRKGLEEEKEWLTKMEKKWARENPPVTGSLLREEEGVLGSSPDNPA